MNIYDIITKTKHGAELSTAEMNWLISRYTSGDIADYQMSAWLMAACFCPLSERETYDMTMAMMNSGDILRLEADKAVIDKHSTGGIGDKISLIAAPAAAACGICVPKMSGRGLGFTGGTIDKLEAIPDFRTELGYDEFTNLVKRSGLAICGQTADLAPADKKLYALRNATATVDCIPLIASSIMCKKLATNPDGIVLNVKVGSGAFMKNIDDAQKLSLAMISIGKAAGIPCVSVISSMDSPLGNAVGNAVEVIEAIEVLKGRGPQDLQEEAFEIAAQMLYLGKIGGIEQCRQLIRESIDNGKALEFFRMMVRNQGGNEMVTEDYSLLPQAERTIPVRAEKTGFISSIDAAECGMVSLMLGAGREDKSSPIDLSAGLIFRKNLADYVEAGEVICDMLTSTVKDTDEIERRLLRAIGYSDAEVRKGPNIINIVN